MHTPDYASRLGSHLPDQGSHLPNLESHFQDLGSHFPDLGSHLPDVGSHFSDLGSHLLPSWVGLCRPPTPEIPSHALALCSPLLQAPPPSPLLLLPGLSQRGGSIPVALGWFQTAGKLRQSLAEGKGQPNPALPARVWGVFAGKTQTTTWVLVLPSLWYSEVQSI